MQEVLKSAIVSAALILGLLVGFPLGNLTRNLLVGPESSSPRPATFLNAKKLGFIFLAGDVYQRPGNNICIHDDQVS